eukprot:3711942-Pyramimonas_sp.AAC.1
MGWRGYAKRKEFQYSPRPAAGARQTQRAESLGKQPGTVPDERDDHEAPPQRLLLHKCGNFLGPVDSLRGIEVRRRASWHAQAL